MKEDDDYRLKVGDLVGERYQIERALGKGGMGEVYAAFHLATLERVALKLVTADGGPDDAERLVREARTANAVKHPSVVTVSDVFEDDGSPVMVMELLHGESLAAYETREGPLEVHDAADILRQVAEGLAAAHALGIVHRDLKPENIFLSKSPDGKRCAKILDFGIAKVLEPERLGILTQYTTKTGMVIGTVPYMSREQLLGGAPVDTRTDIWSFGVVLWEALHGSRPLEYASFAQLLSLLVQGKSPRARAVMPRLTRDVADLLDACLRMDPRDRLGDIGEAADVLGRRLNLAPGASTSGRKSRWRGGRAMLTLGVAAVASATGGALWSPAAKRAAPMASADAGGGGVGVGSKEPRSPRGSFSAAVSPSTEPTASPRVPSPQPPGGEPPRVAGASSRRNPHPPSPPPAAEVKLLEAGAEEAIQGDASDHLRAVMTRHNPYE